MQDRRAELDVLLRECPSLHAAGEANWMIGAGVLRWLMDHVTDRMRTLETGAGYSTVVFAMCGSQHTVVTPQECEIESILKWCKARGISCDRLSFVHSGSQDYLPTLPRSEVFDLALVDGLHGFPFPFLDWYYASRALRDGGLVVLDDIQIRSVKILVEFLQSEKERWEYVEAPEKRAAVFRRKQWPEWTDWFVQPFNLNSRWARKIAASAKM